MNIGPRIEALWNKILTQPQMAISTAVSVVVFMVLYFYLINFLLKNKANVMVTLFTFVMIIGACIVSFVETMSSTIFLLIPSVFIIAIICLYSVEIKRIVWAKSNMKLMDTKHGENVSQDADKIQHCISEIIKALQNMSKNDVGAIIILSTGNVPTQIIDSGVKMDGDISSELIESVFFPKAPLHDGAMIINGTKIVAAGCFLPLAQNVDNIPKELGSRHRAGIGVTETIDVVSIIVSEETGIISIAVGGKIKRYADSEALKKALNRYYWQDLENARK